MKIRTLGILGAAAVVAVGVAVIVGRGGAERGEFITGERMFEGLAARANDVSLVEIRRADGEFSIQRTGEAWGLVEKGGYPAKFDLVRQAVVGLADLRAIEPMTSRSDRYHAIGVQDVEEGDPSDPFSGPTLLTLKDDAGDVLATAIIGNTRQSPRPGIFVRLPGESQSWVAEVVGGRLEIPSQFTQWIEPQILNIPRGRIQSVDVSAPGADTFSVQRSSSEERNFTVLGVPDGHDLSETTAADAFGSALSFLTLEDVNKAADIDFRTSPGSQLQFRTFDGLLVMVELADHDGRTWARIAAAPDPAEGEPSAAVVQEAEQINARLENWAFALPAYKASVMKITMNDMIRGGRPLDMPASMMGEGIEVMDLQQMGEPPQVDGEPELR